MDGSLIVSPTELVGLIGQKGLGKVLEPLMQEIHLLDTYIAGTTHLQDPTVLDALQAGDKLNLQREENRFDDRAILVLNAQKQKLGYIPQTDNLIFSRLMDAGKLLSARILDIHQRGSFKSIRIAIYLMDF